MICTVGFCAIYLYPLPINIAPTPAYRVRAFREAEEAKKYLASPQYGSYFTVNTAVTGTGAPSS